MTKKKLKDTKFGKVAGKILHGAADLIPGGGTVGNIVKDLVNKKFDRNQDGKITIHDFKPIELATIFGGLTLLSYLVSQGVIDIKVLETVAGIFGF